MNITKWATFVERNKLESNNIEPSQRDYFMQRGRGVVFSILIDIQHEQAIHVTFYLTAPGMQLGNSAHRNCTSH